MAGAGAIQNTSSPGTVMDEFEPLQAAAHEGLLLAQIASHTLGCSAHAERGRVKHCNVPIGITTDGTGSIPSEPSG
ncbi:hypothetical protein H257_08351 [Aphanomyces astaci]|uniref:Uncharacterized protein n=1 Tax=Aphanomyces astaci TaxID=112090 RepID=W4GFW3_APHAT|nr:hypothetical protein H257_08351 [Aphanomyces astaci]ETV78151.1 hypothetical protein H257_08351 [Aphanomyces astaci]|eukprot:XP_009832488.1 hypothetical protein H257_08351 [Aphanomyces astaci]